MEQSWLSKANKAGNRLCAGRGSSGSIPGAGASGPLRDDLTVDGLAQTLREYLQPKVTTRAHEVAGRMLSQGCVHGARIAQNDSRTNSVSGSTNRSDPTSRLMVTIKRRTMQCVVHLYFLRPDRF